MISKDFFKEKTNKPLYIYVNGELKYLSHTKDFAKNNPDIIILSYSYFSGQYFIEIKNEKINE